MLQIENRREFRPGWRLDGFTLWHCLSCNEDLPKPRLAENPKDECEASAMQEYYDALNSLSQSIVLRESTPSILELCEVLAGKKSCRSVVSLMHELKASAMKAVQTNGSYEVSGFSAGKWQVYEWEPLDFCKWLVTYCEYEFQRNGTPEIDFETWLDRKEHHCAVSVEFTEYGKTYFFRFKDDLYAEGVEQFSPGQAQRRPG